MNREAARDARYRQNYNDFVNNFKQRVEGDNNYIDNDIIYHWQFEYNREPKPYHPYEDCSRNEMVTIDIKNIKAAIDDGLVLNL